MSPFFEGVSAPRVTHMLVSLYVVPGATHKVRLRALDGRWTAQKAHQESETRNLLEGTIEKNILPEKGSSICLSAN